MQRPLSQARIINAESLCPKAQIFSTDPCESDQLATAERFERARITAADDPELGLLWNRLFDDANP